MKKLVVLILLISTVFTACSTTEEVVPPADYVEPVVENVFAAEPEPVAEPVIDEPLIRKVPEPPAPELEVKPVVEETPVVEEVKEEVVVPVEEPTIKETVLKGKALVDQISEDEKISKNKKTDADPVKEAPAPVVEEVPEAPVVKAEPEVEETVAATELPEAEEPVIERKESPVAVTTEAPKKEETVLDTAINTRILTVVGEIISILIIFALSSVIRNKYSRPLSVGLSFLLAILFTAIPMLIAFILFGWSNLHLMYLVLIFTVFIFSSQRGH